MILVIIYAIDDFDDFDDNFDMKEVGESLGENSDLSTLAQHVILHVLFENTILIILGYSE
jgi:hypothetical protein